MAEEEGCITLNLKGGKRMKICPVGNDKVKTDIEECPVCQG